MSDKNVCIVGAGLVGSMLATYIAQKGINCDLFEKRPDIRDDFQSGNRTIAMSISYRGIKGLEGIGLSDFVKNHSIPKHSRKVHRLDKTTTSQRYGKEGHTINTVDRKLLNETLLNRAEQTGKVNCYFQHQCESLNPESGEITFYDAKRNESKTIQYDWIIGADGLFSNVRQLLESHQIVKTEFLKVNYGYRELLIPPKDDGSYLLEHDHVHVWPRENYIMVGLPSQGNKFTCNLFLPSEGELSLSSIQTDDEVMCLFKQKFPSLIPIMPTLTHDYFYNAASKINAIKCSNWNYKNKILLIGDAAHAIVPFFAMGMNTCFEDCTIFDNLMDKYNNNLSTVFENFGRVRKPDTDAIGDLSYKNFSEISKSPAEKYNIKWKLERTIWDLYPEKWMPCYPMVAFSDMPMSAAINRAEFQDKILGEIISQGHFDKYTENDCIINTVKELFEPLMQNIESLPTL